MKEVYSSVRDINFCVPRALQETAKSFDCDKYGCSTDALTRIASVQWYGRVETVFDDKA